jgi:hypothetical protein
MLHWRGLSIASKAALLALTAASATLLAAKEAASQAPAPAGVAEARKIADEAQERAREAGDKVKRDASDFDSVIGKPGAKPSEAKQVAAAKAAGKAAAEASAATRTAAVYAVALAGGLVANSGAADIANARVAAHAAMAAAQRSYAAALLAEAAYDRIESKDAAVIASVVDLTKASTSEALSHDMQIRDWSVKVIQNNATIDRNATLAMLENDKAKDQLDVAVQQSALVPAPPPSKPRTGKYHTVAGAAPGPANASPTVLKITYTSKGRGATSEVVNGMPSDAAAKLVISPINPANPRHRITLRFIFRYEKSGDLKIPLRSRIRATYDSTKGPPGSYTVAAADIQTIASDFVEAMNMVGVFDAKNPIPDTPVTIEVHDDLGGLVDTLEGWFVISPQLTYLTD